MNEKAEGRDHLIAGEIKSFSAEEWPCEQQQQTKPKHSKPTQQESKQQTTSTSKGNVVKAALCTHLGINIGVKGPTAFELFMVYRALGGRKRRQADVLVQTSNEQMNDDHK